MCKLIVTVSGCLEVSGQRSTCFPPVSDSEHTGLLNPEHQELLIFWKVALEMCCS